MHELFPGPTADFDHPIDLLDHCHARILRNCRLIERIAARLQSHGPDNELREAAHQVVRFFDTAGEAHHRDEDEDLFPALLQMVPTEELGDTRALVERLLADHAQLESAWHEMRHWLRLLAAGGDSGPDPQLALELTALYARHIALEEAQLLPLARRVLEPKVAEQLGLSMAQRRGVKQPAR